MGHNLWKYLAKLEPHVKPDKVEHRLRVMKGERNKKLIIGISLSRLIKRKGLEVRAKFFVGKDKTKEHKIIFKGIRFGWFNFYNKRLPVYVDDIIIDNDISLIKGIPDGYFEIKD